MRVARKYFADDRSVTVAVRPDPAATAKDLAAAPEAGAAGEPLGTPAMFPEDFPVHPPETPVLPTAKFNLGVEAEVFGARLVTLTDRRLPTVALRLVLPGGSDTEPPGKKGLAKLAAEWLRRGPAGETPDAFNERLEAAGASLSISDGGDHSQLTVRFLSDPASRETGLGALRAVLAHPAMDPAEFAKIRAQARAGLVVGWTDPENVAGWTLARELFGEEPATPLTLDAITPGDAKDYFATRYRRDGAMVVATGDVSPEEARAWTEDLLAALAEGAAPRAAYDYPPPPEGRRVLLVDHPAGRQAAVQMATRSYTLASEEKFAGSIAGTILSGGLHARLGRYVRAEKGLAYGVSGFFQPGRHRGQFAVELGTKTESAREAVEACFTVLNALRNEAPGGEEMAEVKKRVSGSLLLSMQTIDQQGNQRLTGMLNGYPADYYDRYAARIEATTAEEVRAVMERYVDEDGTLVVVVAPAAKVKAKLEAWGPVTVQPMPVFPEPDEGGPLGKLRSMFGGGPAPAEGRGDNAPNTGEGEATEPAGGD
jgi:zinc protease